MNVKTIILVLLTASYSIFANLERVQPNSESFSQRPDMVINSVSPLPDQAAQELWTAFYLLDALPAGVTNLKPSFPTHWAGSQVGLYKYLPSIGGVKMKNGIVLSSGKAMSALGPNDNISESGEGGYPGDPDLTAAAGYETSDASVFMLSFNTNSTVEGFTFTFSFGTEEFPDFVGTKFNDPFLVLLDGQNICKDSEGNKITVNSMFFDIDNTQANGAPVNLEWNGFTYVLKCSAALTPGDHILKFAVCDASDYRLDSGVFLSDFKFEFDNTIMIPEVNIIDDQEFTVAPTQVSDFIAGTIENLSPFGPVTIEDISNSSEFHLNGFNILTSAPTDIKLNDEFTIKVAAKLDTTFAGSPWIVYDTATMTIKVAGNPPWPEIEKATILDKNGDGYADSISVEFEYQFPEVYTLLKAAFSWPQGIINYNENLNNSNLTSSFLGFTFSPDAAATIHTDGISSIEVSIDSSDETVSHTGNLQDGIGPLLVDAEVVKRYKPSPDTFTINLTEAVNTNSISGNSFILIKGNDSRKIEIAPISSVADLGNNKKLRFLISDLGNDAPVEGDSLQILSSGSVRDLVNNAAHPDNTPVPINFSDGSLDIFPDFEKAIIYDKDGDGIGDSICVKFVSGIPFGYKYNTADFIWPENQFNYSIDIENDMFINKDILPLDFSPDVSASIHTYGSSTFSLSLDSLGNSIKKETNLTDGIGPLLKDATVIERYSPGEDSFTVNITEAVNVSDISGKSFILIKKDHIKEIEIEPANSVTDILNGSRIQFNIADLGTDAPAEGDSLKILSSGPVKDLLGNRAHKDNTPVPIKFDDGSLDTFPQINEAYVYDKNGDGIGDSVVIELAEDLPNAYILKTTDFSWPADQFNYSISLDNNIIINNKLIPFSFNPDNNSPVKTDGSSNISLIVDSLKVDVKRDGVIKDRIGPILYSASVVKRYDDGVDTFRVTISESVLSENIEGKSFILLKGQNSKEIELSPLSAVIASNNQTSLLFTVEDLGADSPEPGDSLKILHSGSVMDLLNNRAHKNNPAVPLEFLDGSVPLINAAYKDINGDGIVDRITAQFSDTVPSLDSIEFKAKWDNGAISSYTSAQFVSDDNITIEIDLSDKFNDHSKIIDKTSGNMTLISHWTKTGAQYQIDVTDSAAPVLTRAIYYPQTFADFNSRSAQDSITIAFSEPVSHINSSEPFWFEDNFMNDYKMTLVEKTTYIGRTTFTISSISNNVIPMAGDSVWINFEENVMDNNNNAQTVETNKKVPLEIVTPPFTLEPIVLSKKNCYIPDALKLNGAVEKGAAILLRPNIYVPKNILEEIEYEGSIYDATGSIIMSFSTNDSEEKLIECGVVKGDQPNGIVILWSKKNLGKRNAGSSMYVGYLKISYPGNRTSESKIVIPVQNDY